MKTRKKGVIVPGRAEILGGGFVLTILATVAIMRGGPDVSRAAVPPVPVMQKSQSVAATPQPIRQSTDPSLYETPLPQALPPKPLTAQPSKSANDAATDSRGY